MVKVIKGGKLVLEASVVEATLVMENGKITAILDKDADVSALYGECEVMDVSGKIVVPGGIDPHVHFAAFGTIHAADGFETGSRAALAGGTTTVIDFCERGEGQSPVDVIHAVREEARNTMVDVALHYSFTENYEEELAALDAIMAEGIAGFKAYTTYDGTTLLPGDFRAIMQKIAGRGGILIHAEEKSIIDNLRAHFDGDETDMTAFDKTRPAICERIASENVLAIANETGCKVCIAHVSTKDVCDIRARENGNPNFYIETCPHYMEFTVENMAGENGCLYTMNPPLHEKSHREGIREAVKKGYMDMISTDHCSYLEQYKRGQTYCTIPCGVDGAQSRMEYVYSEMVAGGHISLNDYARVTATNAAKFYNLYPRKGVIAVGSDADLAIIDPAVEWTYGKDKIAGSTDYTIFEGKKLTGKCVCTVKGGEVVMKDGVVLSKPGSGEILKANQ